MNNFRHIKTLFLVSIFLSGLSSLAFSQEVTVEDGLVNLYSTQNPDGSWGGAEDSINGVFPSTSTAVGALKIFESVPSSNQATAINYLLSQDLTVTDYLSRRIIALSGTGHDTSADKDAVLALQNMDGGWGAAEGYGSNNLDTALAVSALSMNPGAFQDEILSGVFYLQNTQNPDGGWGLTAGDRSEIYYTAKVLQALLVLSPTTEQFQAITSGAQFLSAHKNTGEGYGEGGSTVWETALAFLVLSKTSGDVEAQLETLDFLLNAQLPNGSWNNDPYSTALALQALAAAKPLEDEVDNDGDGFTEKDGDCNDSDSSIYPGASDLTVDGIDQNCDGIDGPPTGDTDADGDGVTGAEGDCNDNDPMTYPGGTDTEGDGIDSNCDGVDGVTAVKILSIDIFRQQGGEMIHETSFGAYETAYIAVRLNDPSVPFTLTLQDPDGNALELGDTGEFHTFDTLNFAPGAYTLTARAVSAATETILDEATAVLSIEAVTAVPGGILGLFPSSTHVGATETVTLAVSLSNASNVPVSVTIQHTIQSPSGVVLDQGLRQAAIGPESEVVDLILSTFSHTFSEKGEYPASVTISEGERVLATLGGSLSAAPVIRIEPSLSINPGSVLPDGESTIHFEIQLEGVEETP